MLVKSEHSMNRKNFHTLVDRIFDMYGDEFQCTTGLNMTFIARNGYGHILDLVDENGESITVKEFTPHKIAVQVKHRRPPSPPVKSKPKLVALHGGKRMIEEPSSQSYGEQIVASADESHDEQQKVVA